MDSSDLERLTDALDRGLECGTTRPVPTRPFIHQRRRPCPTGLPGLVNMRGQTVEAYQPSPCATSCACCTHCKGEDRAKVPGQYDSKLCVCSWKIRAPVAMPIPGPYDEISLAKAIVVEKPGVVERFWRWLFG